MLSSILSASCTNLRGSISIDWSRDRKFGAGRTLADFRIVELFPTSELIRRGNVPRLPPDFRFWGKTVLISATYNNSSQAHVYKISTLHLPFHVARLDKLPRAHAGIDRESHNATLLSGHMGIKWRDTVD